MRARISQANHLATRQTGKRREVRIIKVTGLFYAHHDPLLGIHLIIGTADDFSPLLKLTEKLKNAFNRTQFRLVLSATHHKFTQSCNDPIFYRQKGIMLRI